MGLREQIKHANSDSEIASLLTKGKSFESASDVTKKAWKSTARVRLQELNNQNTQSQNEKSQVIKKSKNKSKSTK